MVMAAMALAVYALHQRDFAQAEQWYRKSLAMKEKQGNEQGAALTYHQLGRIAQEQRDFAQDGQSYGWSRGEVRCITAHRSRT